MAHLQRRDTPAGIRWVVRHSTPDGAERSKTFTTKAAAKRYQTTVEASQHSGSYVDPRSGSALFGTVAEHWHAGRVDLAPSTMSRNRTYLDAYLLPTFGAVPVARITTADLQGWISNLHDGGKAAATISKTVSMLRAILDVAVRDKLIASSPAAVKLELPKVKQREMVVLTADQVADLSQASGVFYRTLILTAAQTGMRWGELAGLPVENVDLLRGEIQVSQQLVEIDGHHHITDQLKTPTSRRTVAIGRAQADLLGEHLGRFPNDLGLVFTSTEGKYLRRSNFARQVLKPAAQQITAPGLRFHDLRHTHASLLLASGELVTEVSKRLGHRNPKITLEIYAHAIPGMERSSADTMDDLFGSVPTTVADFRDRSDGMETGRDNSSTVVDLPQER